MLPWAQGSHNREQGPVFKIRPWENVAADTGSLSLDEFMRLVGSIGLKSEPEMEQEFEDALRFFDQDGRRRTRSSRTLCDSSTRTVGDGAGVRGRSEVLRQGRSRTHQCAAAQVSATVVRGTARKRGPQRADENGRCQGRRKDRLSWYWLIPPFLPASMDWYIGCCFFLCLVTDIS